MIYKGFQSWHADIGTKIEVWTGRFTRSEPISLTSARCRRVLSKHICVDMFWVDDKEPGKCNLADRLICPRIQGRYDEVQMELLVKWNMYYLSRIWRSWLGASHLPECIFKPVWDWGKSAQKDNKGVEHTSNLGLSIQKAAENTKFQGQPHYDRH